VRPWQQRQLDGIQWMARHDRRTRARTRAWSIATIATGSVYAGAATAAYVVVTR
jgi:hypothetical protein